MTEEEFNSYDDAAASLQMDLNYALWTSGAGSFEAWVAEQEARRYFNPENEHEEHRNSIRQG